MQHAWQSWGDNIKMDIKELGCEDVEWIHLAQGRFQWRAVVNTAMKLPVPQKAGSLLTS
jgi:hypothetical protein